MFSVSPEIWSVLSLASRWLFAFFALMLLLFAFSWHRAARREHRERFRNLPGAGTVGELVVLSETGELAAGSWFPVPREGVLGSLRSNDLVVPCPGVRAQHLDFSWQDGTGLMVRPRAGCEVLVDGVPVSRRAAYAGAPLVHGSVLQVGTAVLRLQLFSALSHTNRTFIPPSPLNGQPAVYVPQQPPMPPACPPAAAQSWQAPPYPVPPAPVPEPVPVSERPPESASPDLPDPAQQAPAGTQRRRRTEGWKEDWSE